MEKGVCKEKKKQILKQVFQRVLKDGEDRGWECCLEEFELFDAFAVLKIRFSNHQIIKISMIYVYLKLGVMKKCYNSNEYSFKWGLY